MTRQAIRVAAPTRLHLGLLDCSDATVRRYGGIGIALEEPCVRLHVTPCTGSDHQVRGLEHDSDLASTILELAAEVTQERWAARIEFVNLPPRHAGLGTGTASRLAAVAGVARLAGKRLKRQDLVRISQRGGTSGIGVNTFFKGGVVFDGGHPAEIAMPFVPSAQQKFHGTPPIIARHILPIQWGILLMYPLGSRIEGATELDLFQRHMPIPHWESLEAIALAYHGVAPAIVDRNIVSLASALRDMHLVGFKKRELDNQSEQVRALVSLLHEKENIASGLSSFGPLVYAIYRKDDETAYGHIDTSAKSFGLTALPALPTACGFRVEPLKDA